MPLNTSPLLEHRRVGCWPGPLIVHTSTILPWPEGRNAINLSSRLNSLIKDTNQRNVSTSLFLKSHICTRMIARTNTKFLGSHKCRRQCDRKFSAVSNFFTEGNVSFDKTKNVYTWVYSIQQCNKSKKCKNVIHNGQQNFLAKLYLSNHCNKDWSSLILPRAPTDRPQAV